MGKSDVIFKRQKIAEGDWQIQAHCPGAKIEYINGFKSEAEIEEWLASSRRQDWEKLRGYAK
jgi:hypothetical protein